MSVKVTILGVTGTIGDNMLSLLRMHHDKASLFAVSAHKNIAKLSEIIAEFRPQYAALAELDDASELLSICQKTGTQLLVGETAISEIAAMKVDLVVGAIVGMAGLPSIISAVKSGQTIALANKESLVAAGHLVMPMLPEYGATIIPVDSEHNAIFQCLMGQDRGAVKKITLTASGGPFLNHDIAQLAHVTKEDALAHPNWVMGAKVSIDSATMMNKGLELIEAAHLFQASAHDLEAIIHPQSLIHGMVEYNDGSVIAHVATADMKLPLGFALGLGERLTTGTKPLNLIEICQMTFHEIDKDKYPCFAIATKVIDTAPENAIIMNAANEVAVAAFLANGISFMQIAEIIDATLNHSLSGKASDLESVLALDEEARHHAASFVNGAQ